MAALNFPTSPTLNQTYTANGTTWQWNGTSWISYQLNTFLSLSGGTLTGGLKEAKVAMAANDINLNSGNCFTKTITAITTLTVSNVPTTGTLATFILDLTNGGAFTITWWANVKWAGGTVPTLTASGRDVLGFFTHDGGTTWTGLLLGKDVK